jgi:hypothetical protein
VSGIRFKRELEILKEQRCVPLLMRELTIGGEIEQSVHAAEDRQRELRIAVIDHRLREVRGHVENEFAVSQQQDRARRDFERSR